MLQELVNQLPSDVPLLIKRFYSDKKKSVPLWFVEIDHSIKESGGDLLTTFNKAKEKWENGRKS